MFPKDCKGSSGKFAANSNLQVFSPSTSLKVYLLQVSGQTVVEVLHGVLLVIEQCILTIRGRSPGGEDWLGDAGPVAPRAPVLAVRAVLDGAGGDAGATGSDQMQPPTHAAGAGDAAAAAGAGDAAGAGGALAKVRHAEEWCWPAGDEQSCRVSEEWCCWGRKGIL